MWDRLTKIDIEQAKHELKTRRAEIIRKQAAESEILKGDLIELDTLNNLIDIFSLKFLGSNKIVHAPVAVPVTDKKPIPVSTPHPVPIPAPVAHQNAGRSTGHETRHHHHHHRRERPRSNFAIFANAVARSVSAG